MSSIEELKIIRLYRAYNTVLQLCHDRGYTIHRPSLIAGAIAERKVYDPDEGLDYDWFLHHFVISPNTAPHKNHERIKSAPDAAEGLTVSEAEAIRRRVSEGEWIAMRHLMRLTCSRSDPTEPATKATTSGPPEDMADGDKVGHSTLMVFFSGSPQLSVKEVQECRQKALQKAAKEMIIVANKIVPAVKRDVLELSGRLDADTKQELLRIQVLEEDTLCFNFARHEMAPKHIPLTESQTQAFLASRRLNLQQLPRILISDPIVQYLGLQRGTVVKVLRESAESGPYEMFRQVI